MPLLNLQQKKMRKKPNYIWMKDKQMEKLLELKFYQKKIALKYNKNIK